MLIAEPAIANRLILVHEMGTMRETSSCRINSPYPAQQEATVLKRGIGEEKLLPPGRRYDESDVAGPCRIANCHEPCSRPANMMVIAVSK